MSDDFVSFDEIRGRVAGVLDAALLPDDVVPLYLVRNLLGRVSVSASDPVRENDAGRDALQRLAHALRDELGPHGYSVEDAVLFVDPAMLDTLAAAPRELRPGIYWVERLVTGRDWWTVADSPSEGGPARCTLFSVKGGVGRSTSAAVLAWHLARRGQQVLVVDLDLESPGLSSAMLDARAQPRFGVADWFVEELVGQGEQVVQQMMGAPAWAHDLAGDVRVAPAHGQDPGEYLAKLGRVYMDSEDDPWAARLKRLLRRLEDDFKPTVVLLESRSGLHDIAAASVTDIDARVLLFAIDSNSTWTDYGILFRHWREQGLAGRIRDRFSIVSALTPELDTERYLQRFREQAWNLFRDGLYGAMEPSADAGDPYTFDRDEEDAPHVPFPIHWTRGLAAGASLIDLEATPVLQAYRDFLRRFDGLLVTSRGERG